MLSNSASHDGLAKSQPFSMVPHDFVFEMAGPGPGLESRGSHHSRFPTPSISPIVTESDIASPPTRSTQRAYGSYEIGYDNLGQGSVQWTEPEHGVRLHPAVPCPEPQTHLPNTLAPVSPTPTHDNYDHSHRKCEPEYFSWQNIQTQTPPVWSHDVPGYRTQPDNPAAPYRYPSNQFPVSCFDPITSRNYDSNGFSDQEGRKSQMVKMETLRKRRHNIASSESGSEQRQTKSRLAGGARRKGTGTPTINTQATKDTMSETNGVSKKGRKTTATMGPGGMLSPTSPVLTTDTLDAEGSPHEETNHSDDEDSCEMDETADQNTARLKHNKVERKYRNRLNNHFEQLLGVLPPSGSGRPTALPILPSNTTTLHGQLSRGLSSSRKDRERKVSKSEVLDRARMYIQSLENEHRRLVAERKELLQRWDEYGRSNQMGPPPHIHR